ncbi:MAG: hypothetical protein II821_07285 [Treponema sp.]|nr:hypothetical protein [Treponema sp.]
MNIFNIIAELCSLIINSCTEEFFVHYSCISNAEKFRINELILEKIPVFFEKERQGLKIFEIHQFSEEELTESLFVDINDIVEKFKSRNYYFAIVGLIQILDESLETILQKRIAEFQEDDFSVVLNTNRETTGIGLLPRTSCVWERKHRLSHSYNRMDNFLFNMLLMENSILGELIDKHFFLKKDLFPNFRENKSLKIAATPLRLNRGFNVIPYSEDMVQYFKIEYDESDYQSENELVWQKILSSSQNESDIIVFPEMLGNPKMTGFISEKIKSLPAEEQQKLPSLIILPSFSTGSYDFRRSFDLCAHDDCNVAWINTCAAIEKGKEQNFENIGYIRKRISRNDDEAQMLCKMPICETAFKGECHRDCIYYETISGV